MGKLYGLRWGLGGKVYSVRKHGVSGAIDRAQHQGRAIYSSKSPGARIRGMFKLPKRRLTKSERKERREEF
jgi:hypothetical protein